MKDRGHKKWTTLMLPEHKVMLNNWQIDQSKIKPPVLDEDRLQELDFAIQELYAAQVEVQITYYESGKSLSIIGQIHRADTQKRMLFINSIGNKICLRVPLDSIQSLQRNE